MLFYDPNQNQSLGYSQPTPQQASKQYLPEFGKLPITAFADLGTPAKIEDILPEGGKPVLDAQESVAAQQTPEAQSLIEGLLTDACKVAIRSAAAHKYALGMMDLVSKDKNAKKKKLETFTSQLRAWPAACQSYWLGTNERDNDDNRQGVADLQTAASEKMTANCAYLNDVGKFIQQAKEAKDAETEVFKAQMLDGGGKFPLAEFHPLEKNAEGIYWYGPVCVRDRVAAVKKINDPKAGLTEVLSFPIPSMFFWYEKGAENNPEFYSVIPAFTDYCGWDAYWALMEHYGSDWDTYWFEATGLGPSQPDVLIFASLSIFDDFLAEQVARIYGVAVKPWVSYGLEAGAEPLPTIVPKQTPTMYPGPFTLGNLIVRGRGLDPEWGGTESENLTVNHTFGEVYAAVAPALTKRQDQRRLALKKGGVFGSESGAGQYYVLLKKNRKIEEAVSTAALLPPVRTKWKSISNPPSGTAGKDYPFDALMAMLSGK